MPDTAQLQVQAALSAWKQAVEALAAKPRDRRLKKAEKDARAAYRDAAMRAFDAKLDLRQEQITEAWDRRANVVEKDEGGPRTHAEKVAAMKAKASKNAKPAPTGVTK